ncbi:MAG: S9 family peptidase [Acidobacteria bacterium]|nr:S9 family peptidase [Acidobacteriota bacterium]
MQPPIAKVVPKLITTHGETRTDNYFWLRDREDPDTIAYLEAENAYTKEKLAPVDALTDKLYQEILGRIQQTDLTVPVPYGPFSYYSRTEEGKAYPIHCRKPLGAVENGEKVLLELNELAKDAAYLRLGNYAVSPDHSMLAYSLDTAGDEVYTVFVKNLATGEIFEKAIPNAYYGLAWYNDSRSFVYVTLDEAKRPYRAWRHTIGAAPDVLLYEETDERFHMTVQGTRSRRFLFLSLHSSITSEFRYLDADDAAQTPVLFTERRHDVEYDLEHHGNRFYVRTNDGGRNFRVSVAPAADPSPENWKEWIAHRPNVLVEGVDAFAGHLVVTEREDGLRRLRVFALSDGTPSTEHTVEMQEQVYAVNLGDNVEFDTAALRYEYTSLVTPRCVYDYNMNTRERALLKQTPVLGGYDPSQYQTLRVHAISHDGVKVPVSVVHRKGLRLDGSNPMLLYGYGSYGIVIEPSFKPERISLLDRGFVYAIAHIRGGSDLGRPWYDDGKILKKKNTFLDFIAAAEHLQKAGYSSPDRTAIMGGSAGGLLMGAVMNKRPELFHAVIAHVPFVDVLNTAEDPTLPLTVIEYEEWGDCRKKEFWDYIRSYAPYENLQSSTYPHLFITTGLNDPRVSYWEPAKWTAKLRSLKQDDNLLLLKTNMSAGHGGASGRYERLKEIALDYAFLLHVMPAAMP